MRERWPGGRRSAGGILQGALTPRALRSRPAFDLRNANGATPSRSVAPESKPRNYSLLFLAFLALAQRALEAAEIVARPAALIFLLGSTIPIGISIKLRLEIRPGGGAA